MYMWEVLIYPQGGYVQPSICAENKVYFVKAYIVYQGLFASNRYSQNHTDYGNPVDMCCYTVN